MGEANDAEVRGLGWIALAEAEVEPVDVSIAKKAKSLLKFGRSSDIDSSGPKYVWGGQVLNDEPPNFPSNAGGNDIDSLISTSTSDTQDWYIEGHTISGTDLTFASQTVTATGQTRAALSTPLYTVTRVVNVGSADNVGIISIYDNADGQSAGGVPTDPTDVAAYIPVGDNQSQNGFTAISSVDYYFITTLLAGVDRQQAATVDFTLEVKQVGGVWRPTHAQMPVNSTAGFAELHLDPVIIVPPNSLIRWQAQSSSASATFVNASFAGYLGLVQ